MKTSASLKVFFSPFRGGYPLLLMVKVAVLVCCKNSDRKLEKCFGFKVLISHFKAKLQFSLL